MAIREKITCKYLYLWRCLRLRENVSYSPVCAFFRQDVGELSPGTALQRGIRNVQVNKAGDLGHVTKSVLYDHHVVASTWRAGEDKQLILKLWE